MCCLISATNIALNTKINFHTIHELIKTAGCKVLVSYLKHFISLCVQAHELESELLPCLDFQDLPRTEGLKPSFVPTLKYFHAQQDQIEAAWIRRAEIFCCH